MTSARPSAPFLDADVRALTPVLKAFARRAMSGSANVDDLVQETLLAAFSGLAAFDERSSLRTWVISILSRKIVDHHRHAKRWATDASCDDLDALLEPPSKPSPERALEGRQALRAVEAALLGLPDSERLAVVLCDVEECPREEVCNVLGVTATHLRVILHRGRHRLRKALEDAGL